MTREIIVTANGPAAIGPYSQGVVVNGVLYVSGQIPLVPATGQLVDGDTRAQALRVMENLKGIIEAAGYALADVVRCTVFLADINDFATVNEVYGSYFAASPPARTTVQAGALPRGARVEIDAIAVRG